MRARFTVTAFVSLLASACGTNRPDIPDYLLKDDAGSAAGYPSGPYAASLNDKGLPIEDIEFAKGWLDPKADGYDPAKLVSIRLSDFYDPDGSKGHELLMLNTAAGWCGACKNEHEGTGTNPSLGEHAAELAPKGLVVLSGLFEDGNFQPAQEKHLVAWAKTYETNFPFVLDPTYKLGTKFAPKDVAPLNLIVDAKTMKLLLGTTGDKSEVIWPFVVGELEKRGK